MNITTHEKGELLTSPAEAITNFKEAMFVAAGFDPATATNVSELEYQRGGDDPAVIKMNVPKGYIQLNKTGDPAGYGATLYEVSDGALSALEAYTPSRDCDAQEEAYLVEELAKRSNSDQLSVKLSFTI